VFGGALDKVTGFLGQRLVLTSLLPAVAFWAAIVALAGSQVGWTRARHWWSHLSGGTNIFLAVVAVALLVLFALVLSGLEGTLIGLYEGYWGRNAAATRLTRFVAAWHRKRVTGIARELGDLDQQIDELGEEIKKLGAQIDSQPAGDQRSTRERERADKTRLFLAKSQRAAALTEFRYRNYPVDPELALPTRLGNILRASEQYPAYEGRYGMDAVFFWPRLLAVVPDSARADLSDARATFVLLLNVCTLALLVSGCAFGALIFAAIRPATDYWVSGAAGLVLAFLLYRSALGPARAYGELVRSTFDLYRGDLLARLDMPEPATFSEERALWQQLAQMMYRGDASQPEVLDAARTGYKHARVRRP
jgi:hypothetical protein